MKRNLKQDLTRAVTLATCLGATVATAVAEPVKLEAMLMPKEQIRLDFAEGSKHFVLMVRREGETNGSGPLAGTSVAEYGLHDVVPGKGGDANGYLVFTGKDGATAYVKWQLRAVFIPGADGKPKLLDNGVWELVGGTGRFKGLEGAGTLNIEFVSKTDRNYILEGEMVSPQRSARR